MFDAAYKEHFSGVCMCVPKAVRGIIPIATSNLLYSESYIGYRAGIAIPKCPSRPSGPFVHTPIHSVHMYLHYVSANNV